MGKQTKWGGAGTTRFPREDSTVLEAGEPIQNAELPIVGASLTLLRGPARRVLFEVNLEGALLGRSVDADVRLLDKSISREHARLRFSRGCFHLADLGSGSGTFVDGLKLTTEIPLPTSCRIRLGGRTELLFMTHDENSASEHERIAGLSGMDAHTGMGNAGLLERQIEEEVVFAQRHRQSVSLIVLDFHVIFDSTQDVEGSHYLTMLSDAAQCVRQTVGAADSTFRSAGEEFAVLVRGGDRHAVLELATRLRRASCELRWRVGPEEVCASPFIGIARFEYREERGASPDDDSDRSRDGSASSFLDAARSAARRGGADGSDDIVVSILGRAPREDVNRDEI